MRRVLVFALILASVSIAAAQDSIRWKWHTAPGLLGAPLKQKNPLHSHLAIEFARAPSAADLDQLRTRGAVVLGPLSNRALVISVAPGFLAPDSATFLGSFSPENKISPLIPGSSSATARDAQELYFVAEFYLDVNMDEARSLAIESGFQVIDNPDLAPNHLLLRGSLDSLAKLVSWDEVQYVFPASDDLVQGVPVNACAGALTSMGPVSTGVPTVGDGWVPPCCNAAALNYAFVSVTDKLPTTSAKSEIVRAYSEWAKYAKLTFSESGDPTAPMTLAVTFASGAHGDSYPFQNTGMIAHTFYPFPLNPEPIAGEMHFNADENWKIGADTDLFSVALHETGHALGLGHSDNPADVMYPYYKRVSGLSSGDTTAILELYAAQNAPPPPAPTAPTAPLSVVVANPPATANTASVTLSGTVTGGVGAVHVSWTNGTASGAVQGSSTWNASIPLQTGANTIVITAVDTQKDTVSATVTIGLQAALPPSTPAPTAIRILQPAASGSYNTASGAITISGTAWDSSGIERVTWSNSQGGSGQAVGTTSWSAGPIALLAGQNVVTVTAYAKSGASASQSTTVSYTPAAPPPPSTPAPSTPAPGTDTTTPSLTILSPTTTNVYSSAATIVFSGTASDNVGVASVTWSNSIGGSGTGTGTTSWTTAPIPLLVGSNMITIRATDAAGNVGWRSVMVTRGQ